MTPRKMMYDALGPVVVKALEKRSFAAQYCSTAEEAKEAVLALVEEGKVVAWGGSQTVDALKIKDALREKGQPMLDRDNAPAEERLSIMKKGLTADVFLMSSNAISQDGQLVNVDGAGNRVAALVFGPDKVIVVAGMNKVVKTVEEAASRVRNWAAPMNAQRFQRGTPCCVTGACGDCLSQNSICANMVITRLCKPAGRIHVILVGEDFGM